MGRAALRSLLLAACLALLARSLRVVDRSAGPDTRPSKPGSGSGGPTARPLFEHFGGVFTGRKFLIAALGQDLPEDLAQQLRACSAVVHGGGRLKASHPNASVWLFVNGEMKTGERFWNVDVRPYLRTGDRAVILGTWWNSTHESFRSRRVTSLWVPFASINFAERRHHSPMDLVDRQNRTHFGGDRRLVAYQQYLCERARGRDVFWDQLNEALAFHRPGLRGTALSKCNGLRDSGERLQLPRDVRQGSTRYDASVGRYERFRFVWASENRLNAHGYVTEKLVNVLLAGAVPVYAGLVPSQLHEIFDSRSFIQVFWDNETNSEGIRRLIAASEDEELYESLLRRDRPAVSDAAMRRFFSWHPDTWERYGDGLRQTIVHEVLAKCRGQ